MKPTPDLPFYDWLADEAIEVMIQDRELPDFDNGLSFEILWSWRLTHPKFLEETYCEF